MLARTFARICALEALAPSALMAADADWPTLAGKFVFDSCLDPIDDMDENMRRPIVIVYTEDDHQKKIAQGGPNFYASHVDFKFELSVVQQFKTDDGPFQDVATTDSEAEAQLDVLEQQLMHALHYGPSGVLFRKMARLPFDEWSSAAHRTSEEGIRLAWRTVSARIRLIQTMTDPAPATLATGAAQLPAPLQDIAQALGSSSYLATVALMAANAAPQMPEAVLLNTVGLDADVKTSTTPAGADTVTHASASNLQGGS